MVKNDDLPVDLGCFPNHFSDKPVIGRWLHTWYLTVRLQLLVVTILGRVVGRLGKWDAETPNVRVGLPLVWMLVRFQVWGIYGQDSPKESKNKSDSQ